MQSIEWKRGCQNSDKTENYTNKGKGKEKDRKRRKEKGWLHSYFLYWLRWWRFLNKKKNCLMVEVYLAVMFLQLRLEIAVIILLPLWESAEASTTYIKASTVLQSSLTVCLNLVSLCWDSSSPSSASSTSTNSLLNLGLPSRAFASLSFLQWRLIFYNEYLLMNFYKGTNYFEKFVLVYYTICKEWKIMTRRVITGHITPITAWSRHPKSVITRKGEIMSVSMSVICDHPVITKYFYWGSTRD